MFVLVGMPVSLPVVCLFFDFWPDEAGFLRMFESVFSGCFMFLLLFSWGV